ncbi:MAG: hypothetical protein R3E12_20530 [Candidatus Eisenbacteria bacterium]|uniref:Uncharacterized protein n=1 Tax=Eiseniibacteriota bacterium TaxID=2212470 RepID=A0A956LZN9_UNCEI|nr:hypothetical protein [Candidatus Eisenbacteria bacterium]
MIPPALLVGRIGRWPLFVPLFLLYPLFVLAWIVAVFGVLVLRGDRTTSGRGWPRLCLAGLALVCRTRGLRLEVEPRAGVPVRARIW